VRLAHQVSLSRTTTGSGDVSHGVPISEAHPHLQWFDAETAQVGRVLDDRRAGVSVNVRGDMVTGTVGAPGTGLSCWQTLIDAAEPAASHPSGSNALRGLLWIALAGLVIYLIIK
jgi:hypothetical protein